ncbi:unnamed protein product [Paramecium octaurelia]|uniref:Uncharacterized protein n=1 Tax=Paramecium octaurelia TaxID=43137 RepID=A0A8S1S4L3_PAROT|nr:unnamed protein product [Paramecium octaurelia]
MDYRFISKFQKTGLHYMKICLCKNKETLNQWKLKMVYIQFKEIRQIIQSKMKEYEILEVLIIISTLALEDENNIPKIQAQNNSLDLSQQVVKLIF